MAVVAVAADPIVGRDEELALMREFLASTVAGPAAFILEGEAGIGKTTLWTAGVSEAEAQGHLVLVARAAGAETKISFAALGDLLADVRLDEIPSLPAPQREALEVALALAAGPPPDTRTIAVAFLGVLRAFSAERPVVVALDDAQWIDRPSADAISFAARRLRREPVGLLVTVRTGEADPLGLQRWLTEGRVERVDIAPLSLGAIHRVVRARLGQALPRRALRRVWEWSGGNPFYAIEAARAVLGGSADVGDRDALPENLSALVEDRLAQLPAVAREPLLAAASLAEPTVAVVERAARDAEAGLEVAVAAKVVEIRAGRVRFSHPLLASAVYAGATENRRRAMHARLAELVPDPEERARHRALGLEGADPDAAAALEDAATHASARGAPAVAAELLEEALRVTTADDVETWGRRAVKAAESHVRAGEAPRARALLVSVIDRLPEGHPVRVDALIDLGEGLGDDIATAIRYVGQAVREAGEDAARRARALTELASLVFIQSDFRRARAVACEALELAESDSDPVLTANALHMLGLVELTLRDEDPIPILERGSKLAAGTELETSYWGPLHWLSHCYLWADDLSAARAILERLYDRAAATGDDAARAAFCIHLAELECRAGNYDIARRYADENWEIAEQQGGAHERGVGLYVTALVDAHVGALDRARTLALEGLEASERAHDRLFPFQLRYVLGFVEGSGGDWSAVDRHLGGLQDVLDELGVGEPGLFPFIPDEVEALVALGRTDEAEGLTERLEHRGRQLDRPRALAAAARCRGMIAADRGDLEEALRCFDRALDEHERFPEVPFERARTLLAMGAAHRRAKRKRAARESLAEALREFDRIGARAWAAKATAELARVGGRAPAAGELTPTERRVAELVAQGQANKEVARELFVTVKSVEAHLSKVYAKLGVRSRAELAHRFRSGDGGKD